jgi:CPA2 family monovalent cation:H+ antiporter-2
VVALVFVAFDFSAIWHSIPPRSTATGLLAMNSDPLLTMVVGGIVAAFALGFIAHKLRISPIVGYLLAGVLIGPYTPGFVADSKLAGELAELGVILIMFGVGLKFSPA